MGRADKALCPGYKCVSGARLFGIVRADGTVAFLGEPLPIDRRFVDVATEGRPPELRFRFAGTCAEAACANWRAGACGIAAATATESSAAAASEIALLRSCLSRSTMLRSSSWARGSQRSPA